MSPPYLQFANELKCLPRQTATDAQLPIGLFYDGADFDFEYFYRKDVPPVFCLFIVVEYGCCLVRTWFRFRFS